MSPLEIDYSIFVDENESLVKGEHAVESNHVVVVTQDPESDTLQLRGHESLSARYDLCSECMYLYMFLFNISQELSDYIYFYNITFLSVSI